MRKFLQADFIKIIPAAATFKKEDYQSAVIFAKAGAIKVESGTDVLYDGTLEADGQINIDLTAAGKDVKVTATSPVAVLGDKVDVHNVTGIKYRGDITPAKFYDKPDSKQI